MNEMLKVGDTVVYVADDEPESGLRGWLRLQEDEHTPLLGVQFFSERPEHFFEHELRRVE